MANTPNLNLARPEPTENWSVQTHFNANMEKIDQFAGIVNSKLFLFGSAQSVSTGTNFNNLTDIKNYVITGNSVAQASDNCPSNNAGKLCTWTIDGGSFDRAWAYGGQIYIDIVGRVFMRTVSTNGSKALSFGQWVMLTPTNVLKSGSNSIGNIIVPGYNTGSGNYVDCFVPCSTGGKTVTAASASASTLVYLPTKRISFSSAPTITVIETNAYGVRLEIAYPSTETANIAGTVYLVNLMLTCS